MPKIKNTTISFLLITFCLLIIGGIKVYGIEQTAKDSMAVDTDLITLEDNFGLPDSIVITPLFLEVDDFVSDADWYRGLFYYQTVRLNQGDILFHYVVLSDGTIVEGNSKKQDQKVPVEGESSPILIAYLASENAQDFEPEAKDPISKLILDIANTQAIPLENISVKRMDFIARDQEAVVMRTDVIGGRWGRSLTNMIDTIRPNYSPIEKQYSFAVENVELPTDTVNYGDDIIANITIKNTSDFALLQGTEGEILVSKVDGDFSNFYVNNVWLSLTQAPLMETGQVIKSDESLTFQLRLSTPLAFEQITEKFQLINAVGQPYPGTEFELTLQVARLDSEVVEILDTETGTLNVRASASGFSEVISRVNPGQRFIVLERNSGGWVKIDLGDNQSGWVSQQYTKTL
ncbi:SH3 domain-containing protein [Candidatus Dojkabacteria bacterium]|uniref:SH3 domain-containing protein n=1 Tax=Candidatus Dojkabacteria bacterium TaxID=2099670 RepID=A0A955RIU2_9BACT|nr:SH3 domain-containing protein [Candidatus Dojkabacteria bacterium]